MGSRTKNADKRKRQGKTGSNTATRPLLAYRGGVKPVFDAKKDNEREELDRMRSEAGAKERAEAQRARRRAKRAMSLTPAHELPLTPTRKTAKTPPKVRKPAETSP